MLNLLINIIYPSLLTAISWGITPFFDKKSLILLNNDYNLALIIKFILGGVISSIFLLFLYFNQKQKLQLKFDNLYKAFNMSFLSALFLIIGYYYFFKALSYRNYTSLVVLISYIIPIIITAILSYFILNEKMNLGMILGIFICIVGIYIFIYYNK